MKYHLLKNIFIASLTATIYWSNIIAHLPVLSKVFGTVAIFASVAVLLTDADHYFAKKKRDRRKERQEKEKSA